MSQLHLDLHGLTSYLNSPWNFGGNVSRAALLLRKDVQRHVLLCRDDLGFKHIRFHGVFDDAMRIVQPDGSYDFTVLEPLLDWLMENGITPFIGLSGVPSALAEIPPASATPGNPILDCVQTLKGLVGGIAEHVSVDIPDDVRQWIQLAASAAKPAPNAPPADLEKWADLVRAFAAFVDGRYGCDAQEWHFEIWNGLDHWTGTQEAYFRLYDLAAKAIKSVNAHFKVGGPSIALKPAAAHDAGDGVDQLDAFLKHVKEPSEAFGLEMSRCDFVTASLSDVSSAAERLKGLRERITTALGESTPLMLVSWDRGGRAHTPDYDSCPAAASVASTMGELADIVTGAMYPTLTDIDDDRPPRFEPFHGGHGLITINEIRKPSFNAFRFLNEHIGYKMEWRWTDPIDGVGVFVTKDYHNVLRILAWNNRPAGTPGAKFSIDGLPASVQWGQVQVLRPGAGSALETWIELNRPAFVNRNLLDDLESASHPAIAEVNFIDFPPRLEPGMVLQLTIPVPDDVLMND